LKFVDAAGDSDSLTSWVAYSLDPESPEERNRFIHGIQAEKGHFIFSNSVLVDGDIDVEDARDRWEQVGLNFNPEIYHKYNWGDSYMYVLHFFTDVENRFRNTDGGKCVLDATTKFKNHDFVDRKDTFENAYSESAREKAKELWEKFGFDEQWEEKAKIRPFIP